MRKCVRCLELDDCFSARCSQSLAGTDGSHSWLPIPREQDDLQRKLRDLRRKEKALVKDEETRLAQHFRAAAEERDRTPMHTVVLPTELRTVCSECGVAMEEPGLHEAWHRQIDHNFRQLFERGAGGV